MPLQGLSLLNRFFTLMTDSQHRSLALVGAVGRQAHPWTNSSLSPDERASMVVKEMTLDEKISLAARNGHGRTQSDEPAGRAIQRRRGIRGGHSAAGHSRHPDVGRGLRSPEQRREWPLFDGAARGRGGAASWDLDAAYEYGALIGRELRAQGYNMSLGEASISPANRAMGAPLNIWAKIPFWPERWWDR